jgi:hypothetical protein
LPSIPVPLAKPDAPVLFGIQPLIETIYRLYRYGEAIDYTGPLAPPLVPEEAAWLKKQLRAWADAGR